VFSTVKKAADSEVFLFSELLQKKMAIFSRANTDGGRSKYFFKKNTAKNIKNTARKNSVKK
jgi:hypothetical protein